MLSLVDYSVVEKNDEFVLDLVLSTVGEEKIEGRAVADSFLKAMAGALAQALDETVMINFPQSSFNEESQEYSTCVFVEYRGYNRLGQAISRSCQHAYLLAFVDGYNRSRGYVPLEASSAL